MAAGMTLRDDVRLEGANPAITQLTQAHEMSEGRTTTGTKYAAMASATACTGALLAWDSPMRRAMEESTVSCPTAVAFMCSSPEVLMLPLMTLEPGVLGTGRDSPVEGGGWSRGGAVSIGC